jgi:hypothetical protein
LITLSLLADADFGLRHCFSYAFAPPLPAFIDIVFFDDIDAIIAAAASAIATLLIFHCHYYAITPLPLDISISPGCLRYAVFRLAAG